MGAGLGWQEAGFTSKRKRKVRGGHSQEGTEKRSRKGASGIMGTSVPHCPWAKCKFCPGVPGGHLIPGPRPVQSQLSSSPGQQLWQWCRLQLWPVVRGFVLGEDQAGKFGISKGQGWPGLRRRAGMMRAGVSLGSRWEAPGSESQQLLSNSSGCQRHGY